MGGPRGVPIFRRFALGDHPAERYSRQECSVSLSLRVRPSRSRGVPCESLDAPENQPKRTCLFCRHSSWASRLVALGRAYGARNVEHGEALEESLLYRATTVG